MVDYNKEFYAFRHTKVRNNIRATVCKFCDMALAYSQRQELLIIVEEHHTCKRMREFLDSGSAPGQSG